MENKKRLQELREERSRILEELNDINDKIESVKNEMYNIPIGKLIKFSCGMECWDAIGIVNSYYMIGNDSKWLVLVGRFVMYPSDDNDHTFPEYACRIEISLNDIGWFKESIKEIGEVDSDVDKIYDIVIGKVKESLENEMLTD